MQVLASVAPTVVECVPAPQLMQVLATVAPTVVEYLPPSQLVQASKDTVFLYLPAAHETQLCASCPVWPTGHPGTIQSCGASLPAGEDLPAPQLMQVLATVAPTVVEYVSAPQLMQVLATVAPTVVEYLPASQLVQADSLVHPRAIEW